MPKRAYHLTKIGFVMNTAEITTDEDEMIKLEFKLLLVSSLRCLYWLPKLTLSTI
jgi:hypothetical protein